MRIILAICMFLIGCNGDSVIVEGTPDDSIIIDKTTYICPSNVLKSNYVIAEDSINFRLEIINATVNKIDKEKISDTLNKFFNVDHRKFTFEVVSVVETMFEDTISITQKFDDYYKLDTTIQIIVIPDNIKLWEERANTKIEGKADGIPTLDNPTKGNDILFIRELSLYTGILAHEVAHVFGLFHTFEGYDIVNKGHNCDKGDYAADTTTPHIDIRLDVNNCKIYVTDEIRNKYTDDEIKDMGHNIQSYAPPKCLQHFTKSQMSKMRKILEIKESLQAASTNL